MSARATQLSVSAVSIASVDLLNQNVTGTFTVTTDIDEGKSVARAGDMGQITGSGWTFDVDLVNTKTAVPARVTNLDLSAVSLLGSNVLAAVESLSVSGAYKHAEGKGVADQWHYPNFVGKSYSGTATILVAAAAVPLVAGFDGAPSAFAGTFTMTLNSVAVTFPVLITSCRHTATVDDVQRLEISFVGQDPGSSDYPAAPTGTTSILEKALNAAQTAVAIVWTTQVAGGAAYTGNALYSSFAFSINQGRVVRNQYSFVGVGAPGIAATV